MTRRFLLWVRHQPKSPPFTEALGTESVGSDENMDGAVVETVLFEIMHLGREDNSLRFSAAFAAFCPSVSQSVTLLSSLANT